MGTIVGRWEWRTFGAVFGEADARLAALEPERVGESDEIYLVSSAVDHAVKIRADLMDIKSLEQVNEAGLEQWRPILKAPLPLSTSDAAMVFSALGSPPPASDGHGYTLEKLLAELRAGGRDVRALPVHKSRRHYTIGGCMAEMTDVVVGEVSADKQKVRTVAIESEDAGRVIDAVRDLGLSGYPNISYPRWLKAAAAVEG